MPARLGVLALILLVEKTLLNVFIDFDRAQASGGLGAVLRIAQHAGFRFVVAFAAALALFTYVRGWRGLKATDAAVRAAPVRGLWILVHCVMVLLLAPLCFVLYRYTPTAASMGLVIALGAAFGGAAVIAGLLAIAPRQLWLDASRALGAIWLYSALAALFGVAAIGMTQSLWHPTAKLTFNLVRLLLGPIKPSLQADSTEMLLSTDRFAVQIADVCSGLEGVGLMLAFSGAWLLYFRREYIFPRALLLIPAGVVAIFLLNIVRIAVLILIGDAGFPEIAVYGFHSQAGWIAFIAVACGLVLLSRHSAWLNREVIDAHASASTDNPTAVYLMPLLAVLAAGVASRATSGSFEFAYPLRLIAGVAGLFAYRRELRSIDWSWTWRAPFVGALVFLLWLAAAHVLLPPAGLPDRLGGVSPTLQAAWIASRLLTSVTIIPVAEELAYRGYLMRRLGRADFESVPYRTIPWPALAISSVVFGLAHGSMWLPGIVAGLAYGLLAKQTDRLGDAVIAHATSNALLAAMVLFAGMWQLW